MKNPNPPQRVYLKNYQIPDFWITHADLTFEISKEFVDVHSILTYKANHSEARPLILNGENLELKKILLAGKELQIADDDFEVSDHELKIPNISGQGEIQIWNRIYPQKNHSLEGLYCSGHIFCTQNEPEGFRKITYFIDRPDNMCVFRTTILGDAKAYPLLLSNGNLREETINEKGIRRCVWDDPFAKPSYLFALVAGDLSIVEDSYQTTSGKNVELLFYVDKGQEKRCDYAMDALKKAMRWDEEVYGLEYDLERYMIVAVDSFNMGAMENKGLNIFNSSYVLADRASATDSDYRGVLAVIAHEYFHNWTGNRVTCRDWFQLTLKEGLTVFREQQFIEDMLQSPVSRIEDVAHLKEHQFAEDASPLSHPIRPESFIEINNFYTTTVYEKGSEVIRMLFHIVGAKNFYKGMKLYFKQFDGQAVTIEDFLAVMSESSGKDLAQFKKWYSTPGTPQVHIELAYAQADKKVHLKITQKIKKSGVDSDSNLLIPLRVAFFRPSGELMKEEVIELKDSFENIELGHFEEHPVASFNRNFSAPVVINIERKKPELQFLLAHETDGVVKWESSQALWTNEILRVHSQAASGTQKLSDQFFAGLSAVIQDPQMAMSLKAKLLIPPGQAYLNSRLSVCDFEGVFRATEQVREQVGSVFENQLRGLYLELEESLLKLEFAFSAEQMGQRQLKNTVLGLIGDSELAFEQIHNAANMTDELAALNFIARLPGMKSKKAIDLFYQKWFGNFLVLNKWMSAQAMAPREDVLQRIQEIEVMPVFDLKNPNNIRSLFGSFAKQNLVQFHRDDGKGYEFLEKRICKIDSDNPQMASRLSVSFASYQHVDNKRKELMKTSLQRILDYEKLSRDTYEIVNKYLNE